MDKILIFDFGSQTTQLISRRIREIGVYSEIVSCDIPYHSNLLKNVKGIIFSGSPSSVYDKGAPIPDNRFYTTGIPLLGICYGFQRMTIDSNGTVRSLAKKEYGRATISITKSSPLFEGLPESFLSWMSHGDSIEQLGAEFSQLAMSEYHPAAAVNVEKQLYGIQFHPEVTHCEFGREILMNFICNICGAKKQWSMEQYFKSIAYDITQKVKDKKVLILISGGVDSSVVAALMLQVLEPTQVHLMYIDTGLMRKHETVEVKESLKKLGADNIHIINASNEFLSALKNVYEPEEKRKIIGDLFVTIQQHEIKKYIPGDYLLAQGTLYTDLIESGKGIGKKAKVIKSHHNVRSPLIEEKRATGKLLEPLAKLYKDEVRELGRVLGLSDEVVGRHPFPGPGLGVRIVGNITQEKCNILREADALYISELKKRNLYHLIWQAFSVLLPVRSVGVTGDDRKYGYVLALRAITSKDGMTADAFPMESQDLLEISAKITNQIPEIGRVVYDISSKPPATIEWE